MIHWCFEESMMLLGALTFLREIVNRIRVRFFRKKVNISPSIDEGEQDIFTEWDEKFRLENKAISILAETNNHCTRCKKQVYSTHPDYKPFCSLHCLHEYRYSNKIKLVNAKLVSCCDSHSEVDYESQEIKDRRREILSHNF